MAAEDLKDAVPLRLVSRLVDERLDIPVPLVQRSRPVVDRRPGKAAQVGVSEVAFVDPPRDESLTAARGGKRVELAGASPSAVAARDFLPRHAPRGLRHDSPLFRPSRPNGSR